MAHRFPRRTLPAGAVLVAVVALLVVLRLQSHASGSAAPDAPASAPASAGPYAVTANTEPAGVLPLPVTRPVLNPAVSDRNLSRTVCTGTKKYRPSVEYTDKVKQMELSTPAGSFGQITDPRNGHVYQVPGYGGFAGLGPGDATRVELDHFLPLSDGGDGYDPANLWPEIGGTADAPLAGSDGQPANSRVKDRLEDYVYRQLCPHGSAKRHMTLEQAQALYEPDWYASYVRLGRPGGSNGD
ncbi:MAG: hypothetical protein JWP40_4300 [Blastococcus sp.]|nr:hypothetical protein [Blastococcus sp.]